MNFELIFASRRYRNIVKNLLQFYIYDFSEYVDCDVEEDGLYKAYPDLEEYWKQVSTKFPYIIKKNEKYIGFALVKKKGEKKMQFSIAEFFIMKKYRRGGIGKAVAQQLFNLHKGQWEVHQRENNIPARKFWEKIIGEYAGKKFPVRFKNGRSIQHFNSK